jgi:hypothetical protein
MVKRSSSPTENRMDDDIVYFFVLALLIGIATILVTLYRSHMHVVDLDFDNPLTAFQILSFTIGVDAIVFAALKELAKHSLRLPKIKIKLTHILLGIFGSLMLVLCIIISLMNGSS